MMFEVFFHPLATIELEQAVAHYESIAPGKGLELVECVGACIRQIQAFPDAAPLVRGSVRSVVVQPATRWSYSLHYRVKLGHIRILAFAHQKRQPFYWLTRR